MRLALEEAGAECVFTSEWDRFAQQTYAANFPGSEHKCVGDIRPIAADAVPDHEILVAGFPCQPFSIAGVSKKNSLGRRHGFEDEVQGTLFFDIARILAEKQPEAFLLENVKNLRSHDRGRTFTTILRTLTRLGYTVQTRIIDARAFVPQHRERIFLVGTRADAVTPIDLDALGAHLEASRPTLAEIVHSAFNAERDRPYVINECGDVDAKYTLSARLWQYLQEYAAKHRAAGNGFGFGLVDPRDREAITRTLSARYYKDGSEVLLRQPGHRPRRLTPREAARLMGFDAERLPQHCLRYGLDEWLIPVSDTQAYRQFGNAVVPQVVQLIAEPLVRTVADSLVSTDARPFSDGSLPVAA
jgi:DNA (cytosine-5)-methyltransferase 1